LSALLRMSEQAPFYIFTAFIFAYAVGTLHMPRNLILTAVLVAACVSFVGIPLSGHISDRIGRRKMYLIGAATVGLFGFLYLGMVDTAIPSAVFIAIVLSLIPHNMQYGPQAALVAAAFTPRLRYSGSSLGYQLASVIARSRGADRHRAVRPLSKRLCDLDLHRRRRGGKSGVGDLHARLHRQGYFNGM
jgi:MFS family permease